MAIRAHSFDTFGTPPSTVRLFAKSQNKEEVVLLKVIIYLFFLFYVSMGSKRVIARIKNQALKLSQMSLILSSVSVQYLTHLGQ